MYDIQKLKDFDSKVGIAIELEVDRQRNKLELIASENFVSEMVLEAMGTPLTNKYAEGYPGKRYYGGCEHVDTVETIAIERAKEIFGADHANVQPHSGAQANMAVFYAVLKPGDSFMGMDLSCGGHLSHGMLKNISGSYFNVTTYKVDEKTQLLDYDAIMESAKKVKPKLILAGASAYSRIIDFKKFKEIADVVGAYLMVDMAHIAGLVATGEHPNPVQYADFVTTTTHKTLRGPRGGMILCKKKYAKIIDSAVFPGIQGGPLMHTIAAKAVGFKEVRTNEFKDYQKQVVRNARALSDGLINRGFKIVSGGTDNHLLLVDLTNMNTNGKETQVKLDEVNITCNKNSIPFDKTSPFVTSGIRLGTPAVTSRGMKEKEMDKIAELIEKAVKDFKNNEFFIKEEVKKLCKEFPLY